MIRVNCLYKVNKLVIYQVKKMVIKKIYLKFCFKYVYVILISFYVVFEVDICFIGYYFIQQIQWGVEVQVCEYVVYSFGFVLQQIEVYIIIILDFDKYCV